MTEQLSSHERQDRSRRQLHPGLRYALGVYAVARILTSVVAAMASGSGNIEVFWEGSAAYETIHLAYPHTGRLADLLLGVWYRWDTGWFMTIAVQGYGAVPEAVVFPPLYPLLTGLLGRLLGGEYLLAGLIVSNVAYVAALYLLYRMVKDTFQPRAARWSLVWLASFPVAFYFLAAYTESLFLLLALLTLYAARQRRWLWAGLAACLATLTRWVGWVLVVPVAWEALAATGWRVWPVRPKIWLGQALQAWRGLLAAACAPLGVLVYLGYLRLAGLPSPAEIYTSSWQTQITWPWNSLIEAMRELFSGPPSFVQGLSLILILLFLWLTVLGIRRLRPAWWLYALCSQLFFLLRSYQVHYLDGTLRYLAVLFPCFVVLALYVRNRWLRAGLIVLSGLLQALLVALFAHWYWVS